MGSVENKLVILLISTFLICGTVLYLVLFWVLWPYRVAVAISLLLCIATLIGVLCYVHARGRLIEQDVRLDSISSSTWSGCVSEQPDHVEREKGGRVQCN